MESVEEKANKEENRRRRYCVTGANGYIGSYLVKHLLQSGASVHATLRNPSDTSVQRQLLPFWESANNNRLHLFKADLQQPGSFDEAVNGCHGVFHVAASMQFHIPSDLHTTDTDSSVDHYVDTNIICPAIEGTLNLLKSCSKSSVERVVFTSSISTLTGKNPDGSWKRVVDETCRAGVDLTRTNRASGWIYALSKLLTEEAAVKYCSENGIDLVSVVTSTVAGPFLTETVPSSVRVLLSPVTRDSSFFSILSAVSERMGSIALVHSQDVCSAHLFLMEHPRAEGGYLCCFGSCLLPELVDLLIEEQYLCSNAKSSRSSAVGCAVPCELSSRKLRELGFEFEHDIRCIIRETVACSVERGLLNLDIDDQKSLQRE